MENDQKPPEGVDTFQLPGRPGADAQGTAAPTAPVSSTAGPVAYQPSTTAEPVTPLTPATPQDLGARLSEHESQPAAAASDEPRAGEPIPFDISKLSKEQMQQLKAALAATPDRIQRVKEKPRVKLRRIDGNYVVDFKNAYLGLVEDAENRRQVERHLIPIRFRNADAFVNVLYATFINADQVPCEVVSSRDTEDEMVEGTTISRETGLPVEMIVKSKRVWFTVKLPEGDTIEIEGKIANA